MRRILALTLGILFTLTALTSLASADQTTQSITFWMGYSQEARVNAMKAIGEKFTEKTGITVNFEVVTWPNVAEKWRAAFAAGAMPDVIICLPDQATAMYAAGASVPADDAVGLIGGADKFLTSALDAQKYTDGHYIGVPHYAHARLLIYRADVLKEKGLNPPKTMDEYLAVAKAINNAPSYAFQQLYNTADSGSAFMLDQFMRPLGAKFFDKDFNIVFDSPETVKAVQFLVDLYHEGSQPDAMNYMINDQFKLLNTGATLMTIDSAFTIKSALDSAPEVAKNLDVAEPPSWYITTFPIVICKGEHQDAANQFVAFLFDEQNYADFLWSYQPGMNPTLKSAAADGSKFWDYQGFKDFELALKASKMQAQGIEAGGWAIGFDYGVNPFAGILTSGLVEEMFQEIIVNGTAVQDAVTACAEKMQEAVDEQKDAIGWQG